LEIGHHGGVPSPWCGRGPARLSLELKGACDSVSVKLYTRSMACVGSAKLGPQAQGWAMVTLPPELVQGLSSGAYYYVASIERGSAKGKPALGVWMVLR
jgi:hypothetical protein